MMHATSERSARRMPADPEALAHRIARAQDGRTVAGSARPPLFAADRYRVDDHNVRLKAHRQVDQSCAFLA